MQPYFMPYIGYFQLINAVDVFVFYDDVNFIKQGWINRNKILLNRKEFIFTLPLENASSYKTIRETNINKTLFLNWKKKFLRTLFQAYKKADNFEDIYILVSNILNKEFHSISDYATESIIQVSNYVGLNTRFFCSSTDFKETKILEREMRLIEISKILSASTYINPLGGADLYNSETFNRNGIYLKFLKSNNLSYWQFNIEEFIPWLSIIDVLMFNSKDHVKELLNDYQLL